MNSSARDLPDISIEQSEPPSGTLLCGFTTRGLAGLTAVDFLVEQLTLEQTGYLTAAGLPSVTPFEHGRPTHHTRLFSREGLDVTVLKSELFIPANQGEAVATAIHEWTDAEGVDEVVVLAGIPVQHGPDEHRTYFIATDDYRERRLEGTDVPPMEGGFLDGVNGALVGRGIDSPLGACVLVTPVHQQAPDLEAAIRLVETTDALYDLGVDTAPLKTSAAEVEQYYVDLAERLESEGRREDASSDRMYM